MPIPLKVKMAMFSSLSLDKGKREKDVRMATCSQDKILTTEHLALVERDEEQDGPNCQINLTRSLASSVTRWLDYV